MADFPSTSAASDIWTLRDNFRAEAGDNWPVYTPPSVSVQYLVIAGGGGGAYNGNGSFGGAGGAGGYRSSVTGESSGGGAVHL